MTRRRGNTSRLVRWRGGWWSRFGTAPGGDGAAQGSEPGERTMTEGTPGWVTVENVPTGQRVPLGDLPYDVLISTSRADRHRVRAVLGRRTLIVQVDGRTCVTTPVYPDSRAVTG
ncbi:MAG TPA: hypothetical protein VF755_05645, partial [Catenuloplanes sp.]